MRVLITGAAGFVGRKLGAELSSQGTLAGHAISEIVATDLIEPEIAQSAVPIRSVAYDLCDTSKIGDLLSGVDLVFHLAAIVSANAEKDFSLGNSVNLLATQAMLEHLRKEQNSAKFVFASSVAVYGGDVPQPLNDDTVLLPQTSYGSQKAACEILIKDYSRKGFVKGCCLRLPTVFVRGGEPNLAASTFASSIVRDPLAGKGANCPVTLKSKMFFISPRTVVKGFIHAAGVREEKWGFNRATVLPGITASIGEILDALEEVGGRSVRQRVTMNPDPFIQKIVDGWPPSFTTERADSMGFPKDKAIVDIIRAHVVDELQGQIVS